MTKIMYFSEFTLVELTLQLKKLIGIIRKTFKLNRIEFEVLGQYRKT